MNSSLGLVMSLAIVAVKHNLSSIARDWNRETNHFIVSTVSILIIKSSH